MAKPRPHPTTTRLGDVLRARVQTSADAETITVSAFIRRAVIFWYEHAALANQYQEARR